MVVLVTLSEPPLLMPPPALVETLFVRTQSLTASVPLLLMPLPETARPPEMMRPEMETVAPFGTRKTRNAQAPLTLGRRPLNALMFMPVERSGSALVRVIVPVGNTTMLSVPAVALACSMAARREHLLPPMSQTPSDVLASGSSPVQLTLKVVAARAGVVMSRSRFGNA